jgi:predicted metal-dependent peptidase
MNLIDLKLTRARTFVVRRPEFAPYAVTLMTMAWKELSEGTMATDGKYLYYNPEFVEKTEDYDLIGILIHEAMHILLKHHLRMRGKDVRMWNIACDHVINLILKELKVQMPSWVLCDAQYKGMNAEQVYSQLTRKQEEEQQDDSGQNQENQESQEDSPDQEGQEAAGGEGEDSAQESNEDHEGQGSEEGEDGSDTEGSGNPAVGQDAETTEDSGGSGKQSDYFQEPGGIIEPLNEDGSELTAEEYKELEEETDKQIAKNLMTASRAGNMPGGLKKVLEEVLTPEADWRSHLAEFLDTSAKSDYSMAKVNRRALSRGMILPSLHSTDIGNILVVIDTSGSTIDRDCLNMFLAGLFSLVDSYPNTNVDVVCCDTHPVLIGQFEGGDLPEPEELELVGGGGTSLAKLAEFVEENDLQPTLGLYFTDLELSDWGEELEFPLLAVSDRLPYSFYPVPNWVHSLIKL